MAHQLILSSTVSYFANLLVSPIGQVHESPCGDGECEKTNAEAVGRCQIICHLGIL